MKVYNYTVPIVSEHDVNSIDLPIVNGNEIKQAIFSIVNDELVLTVIYESDVRIPGWSLCRVIRIEDNSEEGVEISDTVEFIGAGKFGNRVYMLYI